MPGADAQAFAESLERRARAARGLEHDLLTDVPMLYGSPDGWPAGQDPGIEIARLHREELLRKNGGGIPPSSGSSSGERLPFEGAMAVLVILYVLFRHFHPLA